MAKTNLIRQATPSDFEAVDALLARSYPALLKGAYPPSVLVTAIPLIARAQPQLLASGTYYVVVEEDEIVGAGGWTRAQPGRASGGRARVGHIRHVVTDHRHVRRGIGRHLMEHIFAATREAGLTRLECFATTMAVPFYTSVGFATIGPMTVSLRPGIDLPAVHMRRGR
ncbi:MAG: GNAT family N-acetyltransferase [Pseudomonadota bacterium]